MFVIFYQRNHSFIVVLEKSKSVIFKTSNKILSHVAIFEKNQNFVHTLPYMLVPDIVLVRHYVSDKYTDCFHKLKIQ